MDVYKKYFRRAGEVFHLAGEVFHLAEKFFTWQRSLSPGRVGCQVNPITERYELTRRKYNSLTRKYSAPNSNYWPRATPTGGGGLYLWSSITNISHQAHCWHILTTYYWPAQAGQRDLSPRITALASTSENVNNPQNHLSSSYCNCDTNIRTNLN